MKWKKHSVLFILKEVGNLKWGVGVGEGSSGKLEVWGLGRDEWPRIKIYTTMHPEAPFSIDDSNWNAKVFPAMAKMKKTPDTPSTYSRYLCHF